MLKICVLVSGGGTNLQALIDAINDKKITNAKIEVVISNNKNAYALQRATDNNIQSVCVSPKDYENRDIFYDKLKETIDSYNVDLIVLAGYLVAIPSAIVEAYENRIINIHPSLIPSFCGKGYYGLKVHEGVLERGVKVTGATVHFVDCGTDTGAIILQKPVMVMNDDTPESLQKRVMQEAEWQILPKAVDLIANNKVTITNDHKVLISE